MTSFTDTVQNTTDVPEAPEERRYDGPPRIRWNNGQQSKHHNVPDVPGTFYVSEKTLGGMVPAKPWYQVTRYKNEVGYEAETLDIVFIASKSQPFRDVRDEKGKWVRREWQRTWENGVSQSVSTEYLCYVEGFYDPAEPQYGTPVLLVTKGMVGKRMSELLTRYREDLLTEATRVANTSRKDRIRMPMWSFRLRIGPEIERKKGASGKMEDAYVYTETGFGSLVQLPALYIPHEITSELMDSLFVGNTLWQHGRVVYDSYEEWRTTQYTNNNGSEASDEDGDTTRPSSTGGRSVAPQPAGGPQQSGAGYGAKEKPTVPDRPVFSRNQAGEVIDLDMELERITDDELSGMRSTFSQRREAALRKLDWDTEMREQSEASILKKPFTFSKLTTKEQYHVVLQLEAWARGDDIPF